MGDLSTEECEAHPSALAHGGRLTWSELRRETEPANGTTWGDWLWGTAPWWCCWAAAGNRFGFLSRRRDECVVRKQRRSVSVKHPSILGLSLHHSVVCASGRTAARTRTGHWSSWRSSGRIGVEPRERRWPLRDEVTLGSCGLSARGPDESVVW